LPNHFIRYFFQLIGSASFSLFGPFFAPYLSIIKIRGFIVSISRVGTRVDVTTPAWLYELLPLIYLVVGLIVSFGLGGMLATLSGILFFSAGLQVFLMRSRYRKAIRHPRRVPIRDRR
jgi:hypothetical protein